LGDKSRHAVAACAAKINFLPAHPKVAPDPDLAEVLKSANIIELDDRWLAITEAHRGSLGRRSAQRQLMTGAMPE